jgi:archaellum biogenesis protein FlaJ (TadC family)
MITFLTAILACQLVRGDIPTVDNFGNQYEMSFRTIWNSFLGMYQILSSENWTQVLYAATEFQTQYHVAWISATFFIAWFIVANSNIPFGSNTDRIAVVLSMFIAIIVQCPRRMILTNTAREHRRY